MPGLLEQPLDQQNPLSKVQGVEAATVEMGRGESSADRVADIIKKDSELMQLADTRGRQRANAAGLLNSSLAAESAQAAVMERATPLGMQDAQTSATLKLSNQNAINDANKFTASERNNAAGLLQQGNQQSKLQREATDQEKELITSRAQAESGLITDRGKQEYSLQLLRGLQETQLQTALQHLRGDQARDLAEIEGRYQTLAATNQAAGIAMQNHSIALGEILGNENIPPEQKQALVDQQMQLMRSQLAVIGGMGGVNVSDLLNWGSGTVPTTPTTPTTPRPPTTPTTPTTPNTGASMADVFDTVTQGALQETQGGASGDPELLSISRLYDFAVANNKTVRQVASELGRTEENIRMNLAKIGKTLPP